MTSTAAAAEERQQHLQWRSLVPYIYDWFTNHQLAWPSLTCRWGPLVDGAPEKSRQRIYLSEQTDGSEPNKLLLVEADIFRPRVAAAESVLAWSEAGKSPFVSKPVATVFHPGEVNKIRELPQEPKVVVTHTDAPQLYLWNLDAQPDRTGDAGAAAKQMSTPDLTLEGHTDDAEFALGTASGPQPMVASGGKDTLVVLWNVGDYVTSLAAARKAGGGGGGGSKGGATLQAQLRLEGHSNTVEDVCFQPGSAEHLASVGDDHAVLLWDTRSTGGGPVLRVADAHGKQDVHCVDWSELREHFLVTGAADGTVKVWDRRSTAVAVHSFRHHSEAVMRVEWSPHKEGVFLSGADDRLVCIWDLGAKPEGNEGSSGGKRQRLAVPPQLIFQHAGHKAPVVDLQWNPADPWAVMSVSDDAREGGGGTLQLWRPSDLVYRPEEEVLAELEQYRDFIVSGDGSKRKPAGEPSQPAQKEPASAAQSAQPSGSAAAAAAAPAAGAKPAQEETSKPGP